MLQILLKNLKMISFAGRAINILSVVRKIIFIAVVLVFAVQIISFTVKEKIQIKS